MGKLPENFEDWRIPWSEEDFDSDKAARLVFNSRKGEEKAKDLVAERDSKITTLTTELTAEKARKSGTDEEAQQKIQDLLTENQSLKAAAEKPRPQDQKLIDQLTAAHRLGLPEADAKRLQGENFDEILADGKQFAKDHGIELDDDGDNGDGDNGSGAGTGNEGAPPQRQPAARYKTGSNLADRVNVKSDPEAAKVKLPALFE